MEIKPCPFCNSHDVKIWDNSNVHPFHQYWCVVCDNCKAQGPQVFPYKQEESRETVAIRDWNTAERLPF